MVIAFFNFRGVIYEHYVPKGMTMNANYTIKLLSIFLKQLHRKRPHLVSSGSWFFHWDNAPVNTARITKEMLSKKGISLLEHPPYSPDLAPANLFFFSKVKMEMSGLKIDDSSVKTAWERVAGIPLKKQKKITL